MKKNKLGFTIIELLAVILIISLLMILVVPSISKYLKKGTQSYYRSLENEVKTAGADYVETYRSLLPQNIGHVRVIELDELIDNKYIDKVVDEKKNECIGQVTIEKVKTDSYEYYGCIKCGDYYISDGKYCEYDDSLDQFKNGELDNVYADTSDYEIRVPKDVYEVKQSSKFNLPLAEVYYKGELIKNDLEGSPSKVDTNNIGTKEVLYYYHGAKKTIKVKIVDTTNPSKTQVVLKYKNSTGKDYNGQWYSGNIYVKYKATDYTAKGIKGSGIDHYEVSSDGVNFVSLDNENQNDYKKLSTSEQEIIKEGNYIRYVRAVDKDGNIGPVNSYNIKIDKTKPTCTFAGESTDWQPNLNLPESERIESRTIVATCSDTISGCTEATKSKTWVETETAKTKVLAYDMYDLAGNKEVCQKEVNIYLDKKTPVATVQDKALGKEDYHFADNVRVDCGPSGCTTVCDPADSKKTSKYQVTCTVTSTVGLSTNVTFMAKHEYNATYHAKTCQSCNSWGKCSDCYEWDDCCSDCIGHAICYPSGSPWAYCCNGSQCTGRCCKNSGPSYDCCNSWGSYDCSYYTCDIDTSQVSLSGSTCYYK